MPETDSQPRASARWALEVGLLCLGICSAEIVSADRLEDDRFAHLGVEHGLEGRVLDIAQDAQGFIWLAQRSGLHQYDGGRLKTHLHDPEDPSSISDNYVEKLLVDSGGHLWIATHSGGLDRWLPAEEGFRHEIDSLGGSVTDLEELAPGHFLAVIYQRGGRRISIEDGSVEAPPILETVQCLEVDPARKWLWSFGSEGAIRHAPDDLRELRRIRWTAGFGAEYVSSNSFFIDCTTTRNGELWAVAYPSGALRLRPETGEVSVFEHSPADPGSLTGGGPSAVLEDSRGQLWIAGFGGWNRFLPETESFQRFTTHPINRRSLVNDQIHAIFEDGTGQIWLGTDAGAARFDPLRENFRFYSHDPTREASAPAGIVRSFTEDDSGGLWIGTRNKGIARMDRQSGKTTYYSAEPTSDVGMPDDTAWALAYEAPGRLWVGSEAGLARLEIGTGAWQEIPAPSFPGSPRIVSLFSDRHGRLWAGGDYGLFRHDPDSDSLRLVGPAIDSRVLALTDHRSGRLFVAREEEGVTMLDQASANQLEHWPPSHFTTASSNPAAISTLVTVPGPTESVWLGTLGHGLYRWREDDGTWTHFGAERGLPFDTIRALEAEPDGTLWLSSGIETIRFDPRTGDSWRFEAVDGWPTSIQARASYRSSGNELFFGGLDGFVAFFPDSLQLDSAPPRVVLTDLGIGSESVRPRSRQPDSPLATSITLAEEITLRHFQNDFSIELAALHFGDPTRNRFAYQLVGVDNDWVRVSAERSFARYSRIPAGSHLFRAKAANRDGVWSTEEAQLRIRVLPPPWRSPWAWGFYVFAIASLLIWWIRSKIERLELEKELQEKELMVLRGLLPICSYCKKIREDDGQWEPLESYLHSHSEAKLSHGICPGCATEYFGELGLDP